MDVGSLITQAAQKYGVDPDLALSIGRAESGLSANAPDSSAGAIGPMQLMPGTARGLGVNPRDVHQNVEGGVRYIKQLSDRYGGDHDLVAAAYNAGPGAVDHFGGVPPFAETKAYVQKVTGGGQKPLPASTPELDAIFGVKRGAQQPAAAQPQPTTPSASAPPQALTTDDLDQAFGVKRPGPLDALGPAMKGVDRNSPGYKAALAYHVAGHPEFFKGFDRAGAFQHSLLEEESMGMTEEGDAQMERAGQQVAQMFGRKFAYTPDESYQASKDASELARQVRNGKFPVTSMIGGGVGGIIPWLAGGGEVKAAASAPGLAAKTARVAGRIGTTAALSAAQSGVTAFNESSGDVPQRLEQAAPQAALGGMVGLGGGALAEAVPAAARAAKNAVRVGAAKVKEVPGALPNVTAQDTEAALEHVSNLAETSGVHRDDLAAVPTASAKTTGEAIGKRGVAALKLNAGELQGDVREGVINQVGAREEAVPQRIMDAMGDAAGVDPESVKGDFDAYLAKRKTEAVGPAYAKALDVENPRPVMTQKIAALLQEPEVATAYTQAKRMVKSTGREPEIAGLKIDPDTGGHVIDPITQQPVVELHPTPETLDLTKKYVSQSVSRDPFGRVIKTGPEGVDNVFRGQAADRMTEALKEALPGYDKALEEAGDTLGARQAFENGQSAMSSKVDSETHAKMVAGLKNDAERQAFRAGAVKWAQHLKEQGKLTPETLQSELVQKKLANVFGSKSGRVSDLADEAAALKSTGKQMIPKEKKVTPFSEHALHAVEHAIGGFVSHGLTLPVTAAKYGAPVARGAFRAARGMTPGTRSEIVRLLSQHPNATATELQAFARRAAPRARAAAQTAAGRQGTVRRATAALTRGASGYGSGQNE